LYGTTSWCSILPATDHLPRTTGHCPLTIDYRQLFNVLKFLTPAADDVFERPQEEPPE
jgi:hypothetical protein